MGAEVASSRHAVAAESAHNMAFAGNDLAGLEVVDVGSHAHDLAHELMADDHRNRNGALRPLVPVIDVNVRSADARTGNANKNVVNADGGFGDVLQPQAFPGARFNEGFHTRIVAETRAKCFYFWAWSAFRNSR